MPGKQRKELLSDAQLSVEIQSLKCQANINCRNNARAKRTLLDKNRCGFKSNGTDEPCPSTFNSNVDLWRHEFTHLPVNLWPYVCEICGHKFQQPTHLNNHIASMHTVGAKTHNMCLCDYPAADPSQMQHHFELKKGKPDGKRHGWAKFRNEIGNMPKKNLKAKSLSPKKRLAKVIVPSPAQVSPPRFDSQQMQLPNLQLQPNIPQQSPWMDNSGFDMFPLAQLTTTTNQMAQPNEPYQQQNAYHNVDEAYWSPEMQCMNVNTIDPPAAAESGALVETIAAANDISQPQDAGWNADFPLFPGFGFGGFENHSRFELDFNFNLGSVTSCDSTPEQKGDAGRDNQHQIATVHTGIDNFGIHSHLNHSMAVSTQY
jgi:hypothetical protein